MSEFDIYEMKFDDYDVELPSGTIQNGWEGFETAEPPKEALLQQPIGTVGAFYERIDHYTVVVMGDANVKRLEYYVERLAWWTRETKYYVKCVSKKNVTDRYRNAISQEVAAHLERNVLLRDANENAKLAMAAVEKANEESKQQHEQTVSETKKIAKEAGTNALFAAFLGAIVGGIFTILASMITVYYAVTPNTRENVAPTLETCQHVPDAGVSTSTIDAAVIDAPFATPATSPLPDSGPRNEQ